MKEHPQWNVDFSKGSSLWSSGCIRLYSLNQEPNCLWPSSRVGDLNKFISSANI